MDPLDDIFSDGLPDALYADPDLALLSLVRLMEALRATEPQRRDAEGGPAAEVVGLIAALRHSGPERDRLLAVLGASTALADHLVAHPEHWRSVTEARPRTAAERIQTLVSAVREPGDDTAYDALRGLSPRAAGHRRARPHLAGPDPDPAGPPRPSPTSRRPRSPSLVIAHAELGEQADHCRLSVIGMGKTGGRERTTSATSMSSSLPSRRTAPTRPQPSRRPPRWRPT